jgi:hypothetical protein
VGRKRTPKVPLQAQLVTTVDELRVIDPAPIRVEVDEVPLRIAAAAKQPEPSIVVPVDVEPAVEDSAPSIPCERVSRVMQRIAQRYPNAAASLA